MLLDNIDHPSPTDCQIKETMSTTPLSASTIQSNNETEAICAFVAKHLLAEALAAKQVLLLNGKPSQFGHILSRTLFIVVDDVTADTYYNECQVRPTYVAYDEADGPYGEVYPIETIEHYSTRELAEMALNFYLYNLTQSDRRIKNEGECILDILVETPRYKIPTFTDVYDLRDELKSIDLVLVRKNWRESIDELINMRSISADPTHPIEDFEEVTFDGIDFERALTEAMIYNPETTESFTTMS